MDLTPKKKLVYYGGNYSTYVRPKSENEVNQMNAYNKQQEEIAHNKKSVLDTDLYRARRLSLTSPYLSGSSPPPVPTLTS